MWCITCLQLYIIILKTLQQMIVISLGLLKQKKKEKSIIWQNGSVSVPFFYKSCHWKIVSYLILHKLENRKERSQSCHILLSLSPVEETWLTITSCGYHVWPVTFTLPVWSDYAYVNVVLFNSLQSVSSKFVKLKSFHRSSKTVHCTTSMCDRQWKWRLFQ